MFVLDVDTVTLDESVLDDTACCTFDTNGAEWIAGCRNCPKRVFWCTPHHDKVMLRAMEEDRMWHCTACGSKTRDWHAGFFTRPA